MVEFADEVEDADARHANGDPGGAVSAQAGRRSQLRARTLPEAPCRQSVGNPAFRGVNVKGAEQDRVQRRRHDRDSRPISTKSRDGTADRIATPTANDESERGRDQGSRPRKDEEADPLDSDEGLAPGPSQDRSWIAERPPRGRFFRSRLPARRRMWRCSRPVPITRRRRLRPFPIGTQAS